MSDTNVGRGMVPHRPTCRCDECRAERTDIELRALRARLAEAEELVGDMVGVLRGHRFCGDDFPSNGWSEVNAVLARYAKFTRRPVNGRESP